MDSYETPLHIVSAQISELGMTFAQRSVDGKSNEIPTVQKLLEELDISGWIMYETAHCIQPWIRHRRQRRTGAGWKNAVHMEFETKKGKSEEWHYYISSRELTAAELRHHARKEWSVETMHCLLNSYVNSEILEN